MSDQETPLPPPSSPAPTPAGPQSETPPDRASVLDYLLYTASIPERTIRSTSAVVGGALHESAELLVPSAFRTSRSYKLFVRQMIDFMAKDVGGVVREGEEGAASAEVEGYVARKTVSTFIDLAGLATLHVSPMTVLAVLSDVAYGSKEYLRELSVELKAQGVIDKDSTIDNAADLLDAVQNASGGSAESFDLPPISVEGLRAMIAQTREKVNEVDPTKLMPEGEIRRMWNEMHTIAAKEKVSVFNVAGAMSLYSLNKIGAVGQGAVSSVKVAGNLFDRHLLEHYREGLGSIYEKGLYQTVAETSGPYVEAVYSNFSGKRETWTQQLLTGKLFAAAWQWIRGRKSKGEPNA